MIICRSFNFFRAYRTVRGARLLFLTRSLCVIAPPVSSIWNTVFDEGGSVVEYMIVMLTLLTYQCIADLYFPFELLLMFERQERLALLMLVGVVILVVAAHLILENTQKRSFASPFSEISRDGDLVYLSGMIDHLVITKTGGHVIFQINNVSVFIPGQSASDITLHTGENISVVGIVQTYQGKKEVVVQSGSDIASNS